MRLLESDLESAVTLRDAANAADMSVSSFKERFVRAFGISPMAYRRQCRLECAARLLETTGESVARIALSVGYRNPSKFSAAFASAFSHSPSEHRALHRDGERGHGRINPTA
ncbi:helix-turn-helix transcriptional regulator [Rubneribacter badeniensis]